MRLVTRVFPYALDSRSKACHVRDQRMYIRVTTTKTRGTLAAKYIQTSYFYPRHHQVSSGRHRSKGANSPWQSSSNLLSLIPESIPGVVCNSSNNPKYSRPVRTAPETTGVNLKATDVDGHSGKCAFSDFKRMPADTSGVVEGISKMYLEIEFTNSETSGRQE